MNNAFIEWFEGFIAACSEDGPTRSQWKVVTAKLEGEKMKQTGAMSPLKYPEGYRSPSCVTQPNYKTTQSSGQAL